MAIYSLEGERPELPAAGRYWVAESATVAGRVRLGEDTGVWFGAVIRGDNEWIGIGARTNIQDNCTLHSDPGSPLTIGEGCTIGHGAIVHGCTVGDNTLIGMGAVILNRARIGKNCIVGAGALVTEGKEFPDGSLIVGTPARVVRDLDDVAAERQRAAATGYLKKAQRFAAGLDRVDG